MSREKKGSKGKSSKADKGGGDSAAKRAADAKASSELRLKAIRSFKKGSTAKAFKSMSEVIKTYPDDPVSHMIRAALFQELRGEEQKMLADAVRAQELAPKCLRGYYFEAKSKYHEFIQSWNAAEKSKVEDSPAKQAALNQDIVSRAEAVQQLLQTAISLDDLEADPEIFSDGTVYTDLDHGNERMIMELNNFKSNVDAICMQSKFGSNLMINSQRQAEMERRQQQRVLQQLSEVDRVTQEFRGKEREEEEHQIAEVPKKREHSKEPSEELQARQARRNRRENKAGGKGVSRKETSVLDFSSKETQESMWQFWQSMEDQQRQSLLAVPLAELLGEMASDTVASRAQKLACKRFEIQVSDVVQLVQQQRELRGQHKGELALEEQGQLEEQESLLAIDEDPPGARGEAEPGTAIDELLPPTRLLAEVQEEEADEIWRDSQDFEVFKQYCTAYRHVFTFSQQVEEIETAFSCLAWAGDLLETLHQTIQEAAQRCGCEVVSSEDDTLIVVQGAFQKCHAECWPQLLELILEGVPSGASVTKLRRDLSSQRQTAETVQCELESKLSTLQRKHHMMDNVVRGLGEYERVGVENLPDSIPAMHAYQAAFSCSLQHVRRQSEITKQKRETHEELRSVQEQHAKIVEMLRKSPEGELARRYQLKEAQLTQDLEGASETQAQLEALGAQHFNLQRECRTLMDAVTMHVRHRVEASSPVYGSIAGASDELVRDSWYSEYCLTEKDVVLFTTDQCTLGESYAHARWMVDSLEAGMNRFFDAIADCAQCVNEIKLRALLLEDAFIVGSSALADMVQTRFRAAFEEHLEELRRSDTQRREQEEREELERAAAVAKELADGLMEEESSAQQKAGQKQQPQKGKKKKNSAPEEQEKRRRDKEKARLEQEAEAKKAADDAAQEALDLAREQKRKDDAEYERMLAEEQRRLKAIQEEQQRAAEALQAQQAQQAHLEEEARRVKAERAAEERAQRAKEREAAMAHDVGDCAMAPGEWQCDTCTFVNAEADSACAMCGQKSANATPVSASVEAAPLVMEPEEDLGGEWHSVNNAKEEKKLKAEKRAVTDEDVQQELGTIVAEELASFEQVGEMASHLTDVEPWLAKEVVTKLAVKMREGLDEGASWAAFQQLLEASNIPFRSREPLEPAEPSPQEAPVAELQHVPSTPKSPGTLAAERATLGLSNSVGERNCFLNVVIQSLWHLQGFRHKFLKTCEEFMSAEAGAKPGDTQSEAVLSALYDVFTAYNAALEGDSSERVVESTSLREALSNVNDDKFQMGLMDDAAEAHEAVLECLEKSWAGSVTDSVFSLELLDHSQVKPLTYKTKVHYIAAAAIRDYVANARDVSTKRRFHTVLKHVLQDQYGTPPEPSPAPPEQPASNGTASKGKGKGKGGRDQDRHAPLELKNYPEVFTLGISWESGNESPENIKRVVDSMDEVLNLATVFSHVSAKASRHGKFHPNLEKRCRMRGMICYYGRHFCSFMREGNTENWLVLDDTMVKPVGVFADVVHKCYKGALQPCLIFYEAELKPKGSKPPPEPKPVAEDGMSVVVELPEPRPENQ